MKSRHIRIEDVDRFPLVLPDEPSTLALLEVIMYNPAAWTKKGRRMNKLGICRTLGIKSAELELLLARLRNQVGGETA
jgi:hypothetical protein